MFSDCDQEKLVIYARLGSTAEQFARDHGIKIGYSFEEVCAFWVDEPQTASISPGKSQDALIHEETSGEDAELDEAYILALQQKYENDEITEDDMTLEEMKAVHLLYQKQISELRETLRKKLDRF